MNFKKFISVQTIKLYINITQHQNMSKTVGRLNFWEQKKMTWNCFRFIWTIHASHNNYSLEQFIQEVCTIHLIPDAILSFFFYWRDYEWALKKSLSLTEILVFKKNCMSSKEKTLRVTRLTGKVINIEQAYNAINCQVETRGYYSQFIDSFSLQISLTTSATVATSNYFVSTRLKFEALVFIHHYFIPIILV